MKSSKIKLSHDEASPRAFDDWKVGSPWLRLGAQVLDQGLVGFASASALALWFPQKIWTLGWWSTLFTLWIFVSALTQFLFFTLYKNSPGKKALGLKLVSVKPQGHITVSQIFIRTFTWWLGAVTLSAGWSTILTRPDRRAWHDLAAETIVVGHHARKPHYPTISERKFGEGLLVTLSFGFSALLVLVLLAQLRHLQNGGDKKTFALAHSNETIQDTLEKQSWILFSGNTLQSSDETLSGDRKRLSQLMSAFEKANLLPLGERYSFYKVNMEETEDELCRQGQEASAECASARLLVQLLTPFPEKQANPKGLPGLQALLQVQTAGKLSEQLKTIDETLHQLPQYASEAFAYRTYQLKLLVRAGQFKKARDLAVSDLNKLHDSRFIADEEIFSHLYLQSACQAVALSDCHFDKRSHCLQNNYWRQWSVGCDQPASTVLNSKAQALGFWWNKLHGDAKAQVDLAQWQKTKELWQSSTLASQTSESATQSFDEPVLAALDFVVTMKQPLPHDLMQKSRKLSPSNLLWGWANQQALDTLGRQWSYLVYPQEQRMLIQLEILESKARRSVASVEPVEHTFHLTPQLTIEK